MLGAGQIRSQHRRLRADCGAAPGTGLIAAHDIILLGERGQGKTCTIRTLVGLLDEWPGHRGLRDQRPSLSACMHDTGGWPTAKLGDDLPVT